MLKRNSNASMWSAVSTRTGLTACLCCEFSTFLAFKFSRLVIPWWPAHPRISSSWPTPLRGTLSWMKAMRSLKGKKEGNHHPLAIAATMEAAVMARHKQPSSELG